MAKDKRSFMEKLADEYISGPEAQRRLKERHNAEIRSRHECQCFSMHRLRMYLGVWQCGICLRPRYAKR